MRPLALFAVLLVGSLLAGPVPKAIKKVKDEDAIIGVWKVEAVEGLDPRLLSYDEIGKTRFYFFEDGQFVFEATNPWSFAAKFQLDTKAEIKAVRFSAYDGLYDLDGDTLRLCYNMKSGIAPIEFKADGRGVIVWTLKRVTNEKSTLKADK